jgi:hypothetical protein
MFLKKARIAIRSDSILSPIEPDRSAKKMISDVAPLVEVFDANSSRGATVTMRAERSGRVGWASRRARGASIPVSAAKIRSTKSFPRVVFRSERVARAFLGSNLDLTDGDTRSANDSAAVGRPSAPSSTDMG